MQDNNISNITFCEPRLSTVKTTTMDSGYRKGERASLLLVDRPDNTVKKHNAAYAWLSERARYWLKAPLT